ncbi:small ribonucleoprotein particle protein SmE [Glossina fuscipes fuscipes]
MAKGRCRDIVEEDADGKSFFLQDLYTHIKANKFLRKSLIKFYTNYKRGPKMSFKGNTKVQKVMVQPINLIFRYLQNRSRVQVWLYENINLRIEGHIVGFDEYMNLVLDDAEEVWVKTRTRKNLGRIMLKGDNITLIQNVSPSKD